MSVRQPHMIRNVSAGLPSPAPNKHRIGEKRMSEDFNGWFLVPMICAIILIALILTPKFDSHFGTAKEEKELMDKVLELESSGYNVNRQSANIFDMFIPSKLIGNYTDFVTFLQENKLTNLHYTTEGTYGPKLWLNYNNTFYYYSEKK